MQGFSCHQDCIPFLSYWSTFYVCWSCSAVWVFQIIHTTCVFWSRVAWTQCNYQLWPPGQMTWSPPNRNNIIYQLFPGPLQLCPVKQSVSGLALWLSLGLQHIVNSIVSFRSESDNSQCSTQRSDLIIIQSVWNDMKKQTKSRLKPWQCLQDASRNLPAKLQYC